MPKVFKKSDKATNYKTDSDQATDLWELDNFKDRIEAYLQSGKRFNDIFQSRSVGDSRSFGVVSKGGHLHPYARSDTDISYNRTLSS